MDVTLTKREPGGVEFGIIYGFIALLALTAARFLPVLVLAPSCAFKRVTGLPCPTCGATRSIVHLAAGDVCDALALNPLIAVLLLFALILLLYDLLTLLFGIRRITVRFSKRERAILRLSAILLVFLNWLYLVHVL